MKNYFLYYITITGQDYTQRFDTLFEFLKAADEAMNNSYVNQDTINFWTKPK